MDPAGRTSAITAILYYLSKTKQERSRLLLGCNVNSAAVMVDETKGGAVDRPTLCSADADESSFAAASAAAAAGRALFIKTLQRDQRQEERSKRGGRRRRRRRRRQQPSFFSPSSSSSSS